MGQSSEQKREGIKNAEDRRKGTTYAECNYCHRIIAAYSKKGKVMKHRLDTGWQGAPLENPFPPNTPCPGSGEYGEVFEGELYQSPVDTLKWVRVQ